MFLPERLETFHGFNLTLSSKIMMVTIKNTVVCDVVLIGQFTKFLEVSAIYIFSIQERRLGSTCSFETPVNFFQTTRTKRQYSSFWHFVSVIYVFYCYFY